MNARSEIVAATETEISRRSALLELLRDLDDVVIDRSIEVLGGPNVAAEWLLSEGLAGLKEAPVKLAQSPEGRKQVLQMLAAIDHGVYL